MDDLKRELVLAFIEWFKSTNVDFWDECNAPEELAEIAVELIEKKKPDRPRVVYGVVC